MMTKTKHLRKLVVSGVALTLLLCTGCGTMGGKLIIGSHQPYRREAVVSLEGSNIKVGAVEFDDQGELWQVKNQNGESQMHQVAQMLKDEVKKGPVKLVVFVHGWNNSASQGNQKKGNMADFSKNLIDIQKATAPGVRVVGVYFGWRGSLVKDKSMLLDYYNREGAAVRIGRASATAALELFTGIARRDERSQVIAIGHSLGAVILLRAVAQPMAADLAQAAASGKEMRRPVADTIVLVNPADNAILARQMVGVMQDLKVEHSRNGRKMPLITCMTSTGDWATHRLYTAASWMGRNVFSVFMTSASGQTSSKHQEEATIRTAGFNPPLFQPRTEALWPEGCASWREGDSDTCG